MDGAQRVKWANHSRKLRIMFIMLNIGVDDASGFKDHLNDLYFVIYTFSFGHRRNIRFLSPGRKVGNGAAGTSFTHR